MTDPVGNSGKWVPVCALDEIPLLGARLIEREDADNIALFRPAADRVFALADRCPHKGGPLSQGIVAGDTVTCPLHGWAISLESGKPCAPDEGCAPRFPVRVVDAVVWLPLQAFEKTAATAAEQVA